MLRRLGAPAECIFADEVETTTTRWASDVSEVAIIHQLDRLMAVQATDEHERTPRNGSVVISAPGELIHSDHEPSMADLGPQLKQGMRTSLEPDGYGSPVTV